MEAKDGEMSKVAKKSRGKRKGQQGGRGVIHGERGKSGEGGGKSKFRMKSTRIADPGLVSEIVSVDSFQTKPTIYNKCIRRCWGSVANCWNFLLL
jgi:hypothetical protein